MAEAEVAVAAESQCHRLRAPRTFYDTPRKYPAVHGYRGSTARAASTLAPS